MRLLVDECCETAIVEALREASHDVIYAAESYPATSDAVLLAHAQADGRVLITADKDFGQLAVRDGKPAAGLILIRMPNDGPSAKARRVCGVLSSGERLDGKMIVISRRDVRVRPLR